MSSDPNGLGLPQGLVRLCEPDPRWASLFAQEQARLAPALDAFAAVIEHCGSTSIPGMPAKPIIDMLIGIPAPIDIPALRHAFAPLGYEHATWAGVPGHEVFGLGDPRTHIVHVVPLNGAAWQRMRRFRDALRADPALAAEYAGLKRELAARHPDDRATYTDGKSSFVTRVLEAG